MTRLFLLAILGCAAARPLEPEVCEECEFVNGVGFLPVPGNCYKYIQCEEVSPGEYRAWEMPCPGRLYWSQRLLTCAREHDGNEECPNDCTTIIETYEVCSSSTPNGSTTTTTPYPCKLEEVPRYPNKYYDEEGNLMTCAPGTVFSLENCTCVIGGNAPTCDDDPWLKFPFDEDYDSTQCDGGTGIPRGNTNITNELCFDGESSVEIGYLKNWFTDNPLKAITISIWFWHDSSITRIQGLFGNGDCNSNPTMLIYVEDNIAKGWLETSNGIQVFTSSSGARAYVQDGWNQVALVYTGWSLEFWINGEKCDQRNPLSGDVLGTQLPSTIGLAYIDCDPNFFNGCLCDFRVYKRVVYEWEMREKVFGEGGCRQN